MTINTKATAEKFVKKISQENSHVPFDAILIGSVARGTQTSHSDIDLVVVAEKPLHVEYYEPFHLQLMTAVQFLQRLHDKDDFACWAIRFGVPMTQSGIWETIRHSADAAQWPNWKTKISHSAKRLALASELFSAGDAEAAKEETFYAVSHAARAILLRYDVFPLSRPEMVEQLRTIGQSALGETMASFWVNNHKTFNLQRTQYYLKKFLFSADRDTYKEAVLDRRRMSASKKSNANLKMPAAVQNFEGNDSV
jgi:predicted nucleotidyltransferase